MGLQLSESVAQDGFQSGTRWNPESWHLGTTQACEIAQQELQLQSEQFHGLQWRSARECQLYSSQSLFDSLLSAECTKRTVHTEVSSTVATDSLKLRDHQSALKLHKKRLK